MDGTAISSFLAVGSSRWGLSRGETCPGLRRLVILVRLMMRKWSEADLIDARFVDGRWGNEENFRDEKNEPIIKYYKL